jgi:arabinogalactan oligomer/maltooligosaccharide transport system permease protein
MNRPQFWLRVAAILAVAIVALALRLRAVARLPIDYDEDDYLLAAQHYAGALSSGDWEEVRDYAYNQEHPPLTKLLYGLAILPLPQAPEIPQLPTTAPPVDSLPEPHFSIARHVSAGLGMLQVLGLAILDPLAGFLLAIHTWQIKYTSQIMLEPLPSLTSTLLVLCYVRARKVSRPAIWLALSGAALGLTAASKYPYCIIAVAVIVDWLWATVPPDRRTLRQPAVLARWLGPVVSWGVISLAVFFVANPRMWTDPVNRLRESVFYHGGYAQSEHVRRAGFPPWQPLVWLSGSVPWHSGVFVFSLDLLISALAVLGVRRLWKKQRVFALWLGITLAFLLVWRTKWPQYILMLTAPLALAAAEGFTGSVWEPLMSQVRRLLERRMARAEERVLPPQTRRALPWLLPGAIVLAVITLFPLIYQGAMALTDINGISIRDGINGGVWREVWMGLTGQVEPQPIDLFATTQPTSQQVHYAGPGVLIQILAGLGASLLLFDILWTVLSVALQAFLGISVALLIHQRGVRLKGFWRTIFIVPWAIPEFVGGVIWLRIFEPRFGWLNLAAVPQDIVLPNWFGDPAHALVAMLVAATWCGFPLIMLAALASLKMIPDEVYEASALDGAGRWRQFRFITWPLLQPLLMPVVIIRAIFSFNQFYLFYTMQPPQPVTTLATVSFFVFNYGSQYAISASINVLTVIVLMLLVLWFSQRSRAIEGVTYA